MEVHRRSEPSLDCLERWRSQDADPLGELGPVERRDLVTEMAVRGRAGHGKSLPAEAGNNKATRIAPVAGRRSRKCPARRFDVTESCDHNDHMKTLRGPSLVGSRELKTRLGSYLRKVQAGATLVVTDRGRPVAELRPIASGKGKLEDRLAELAAIGVVSWKGIVGNLPAPPPALRIGAKTLSSALIEGREDRF